MKSFHVLLLSLMIICSGFVTLAQVVRSKLTSNSFSETNGIYRIDINVNPFYLTLTDTFSKKQLLHTTGSIAVKHRRNTNVFYEKPYTFYQAGNVVYQKTIDRITEMYTENQSHIFILGNALSNQMAQLIYRYNEDHTITLKFYELSAPHKSDEVIEWNIAFHSDKTDAYMGMGMRYNTTNHRGTVVTHWAAEVMPNLALIGENATTQGRDLTYAPVPFYINPKGYGLFLESFNYSVFDFAKTDTQTLRITAETDTLSLKVYPANSPLDIAGAFMLSHGTYTLPKPWVFGVWAAAGSDWQSKVRGQDVNYTVLNTCRNNGITLSAIFCEDWYFDFFSWNPIDDWTINRSYYPDYELMIADQHQAGVKHIGYFLPYISKQKLFKRNPVFTDVDHKGLFTKDKKGKSYVFKFAVWNEAQFDWTNPDAVAYFHNKFYAVAEKSGVDGWMNDFGEYTPYRSVFYNGETGRSMHNKYPLLWAKNARDLLSKRNTMGDYCVFSRSGWAGLHQYNDFIFTGDRNATYDLLSGLGSPIRGVLNAGLSVHPNVSVDIGAYNCEQTKPMSKLMLFRWIELGALIPVMRLHRGLQLCDHWRFDEDTETLQQWKKYAALHKSLFPYIYTLAQQAVDSGWPMVRHLAMYNPSDTVSINQDFEFLLGDRILSSPVIDENPEIGRASMEGARTTWRVYLPEGNWYHYWTNKKYSGGKYYDVPATPGFLPMFIREGRIIPTYQKDADTFVQGVEDPAIKDFEFVNDAITIYFYGYGSDRFTLWDGTVIDCTRLPGQTGTYKVSNDTGRTYQCQFID